MSAIKNEAKLNKLNLKIHPSDPTQAVPLNQPGDTIPDESWSLDQLAQFALTSVAESKRLHVDAACLARKSTVQVFWAGAALTYARPKVEQEGKRWSHWLKERKIPRTNAWEAMELFRLAETVEAVADLTLTQAKRKFKVTKTPKPQPKETVTSATKRSAKKAAAAKEPRNPKWPVISDDKPNPNTPPPPPKENPNSPLAVLVKVRGRLKYLQEDIIKIDWKSESPEDYRRELQEISSLIERIAKEVP
jgi:hypothetical protein